MATSYSKAVLQTAEGRCGGLAIFPHSEMFFRHPNPDAHRSYLLVKAVGRLIGVTNVDSAEHKGPCDIKLGLRLEMG